MTENFWRALVLASAAAIMPASAGENLFTPLGLQRLTPPSPAPDFTLSTLDGRTAALSDFSGKIVFLNFWTTWCPACRAEMPSMERLWSQFRSKGLVILAVDMEESKGRVKGFVEEHGLTFPTLLDSDGKVSARYGIRFIPTTFVLDRSGRIIARVIGPKDWSGPPAQRLFASLLNVQLAAALAQEAQVAVDPAERAIRQFLDRHWARPVPAQGPPPRKFTPLEASLHPKECGVCHPAQLADWKTSFHARAMGPGTMGQLVDMDPGEAGLCQSCHAPLAEQHELVDSSGPAGQISVVKNPAFSRALQRQGLTCAACHVRGWERFGPPRRDGALSSSAPRDQLPHNGVTRTPAFLRSEFCKSCHQFGPDGFALNGKLLENTYEEWKASPYAARGIHCQDCHMPDRRHLWRGIHDPEMVKSALTVDLALSKPRYRVGEQVEATLSVTNSGAGHYVPTYLTPKLFLRMELVDARGRTLPGSGEEAIIGREATLNLSQELYDTRLPPTASFTIKYARVMDRPRLRLRARVVVEPDHFYTRFFKAVIPQAARGRHQLEHALAATERSGFTVFSEEVKLQ
ncbi:MAG: redoxin domain-containing protein [Candidatus Methylomirabilia bacterium]